jgi:hypothetical protein
VAASLNRTVHFLLDDLNESVQMETSKPNGSKRNPAMIRSLAIAALIPALVLAAFPAAAMCFDLPHLTYPADQPAAGSTSGR